MNNPKVYYFVDENTGETYRKEHYCIAQPGKCFWEPEKKNTSPEYFI